MIKTPEELAIEFEIRSVGMTLDQARGYIAKDQSYCLETPQEYIMGQLALLQDYSNGGRHSDSRHVINRLRMAIMENFSIEKKIKEELKL